jgi:hypothetical protein
MRDALQLMCHPSLALPVEGTEPGPRRKNAENAYELALLRTSQVFAGEVHLPVFAQGA